MLKTKFKYYPETTDIAELEKLESILDKLEMKYRVICNRVYKFYVYELWLSKRDLKILQNFGIEVVK